MDSEEDLVEESEEDPQADTAEDFAMEAAQHQDQAR